MMLSSGDKIFLVSAVSLFISIATIAQTNEKAVSITNEHGISDTNTTAILTASSTITTKKAVLLTDPQSTVNTDVAIGKQANQNTITISQANNPTYTASGTMSKKTALLLTNLLRNPHLQVKAVIGKQGTSNSVNLAPSYKASYSASGTMSKKTAVLLTNLLRNPHLKVKAEIGNQKLKRPSNPTEVTVNYTITGKTDRQTALKLKRYLQNNKNIKISAHATVNLPSNTTEHRSYTQRPQPFNSEYIGTYKPFYFYGRPPAYIQGNIIWFPIPVTTVNPNIHQAPNPVNHSLDVVNN